VECFSHLDEHPPRRTLTNIMKLLDAYELGGAPLAPSFARQLVTTDKRHTLDGWLRGLPARTKPRHRERARWLVEHLRSCVAQDTAAASQPEPLTLQHTATRAFEEEYWNTVANLSTGEFVNKNNADCVLDKASQALLSHHGRDLEAMGDHI